MEGATSPLRFLITMRETINGTNQRIFNWDTLIERIWTFFGDNKDDYGLIGIQNATIIKATTGNPAAGASYVGQICVNTHDKTVKIREGTNWREIGTWS